MKTGLCVAVALMVYTAGSALADQGRLRRVDLHGLGSIRPEGGVCTTTKCPGTLRANIYQGWPGELKGELVIPIEVERDADSFSSCQKVIGSGSLKEGQFAVRFNGKLCHPNPAITFSVSGDIQIFSNTQVCAAQDEKAAVGTLQMFGSTGAIGVLPFGGPALTSIVGIAGSIPICDP